MIPAPVMHVLVTMALLCNLSLTPVLPEPMPPAMTAGAVLTAPEPEVEQPTGPGPCPPPFSEKAGTGYGLGPPERKRKRPPVG